MLNEARHTVAISTDIGLTKDSNQDSALVLQANTKSGAILLAVLCDGMGGLSKGELASATIIRAFREWFMQEMPSILLREDFPRCLRASWDELIQAQNLRLAEYGTRNHLQLGSTVTALLLVQDQYYIVNVGDGRVYLLADDLYQLTHDQTFVQKEIDAGRMTLEQATLDPRRSVLLQCVGASPNVYPDFLTGTLLAGQRLLLCCDGFRHLITPGEIYEALSSQNAPDGEQMQRNLDGLVTLNKQRQETDNITALLVDF